MLPQLFILLSNRENMAQPLDPNDLVTLEELALSNMWENAALVELLERKGVLTKQEVLDMIQELRRKQPQATTLVASPHGSTRQSQ